jgi:predicted amidohydrolase
MSHRVAVIQMCSTDDVKANLLQAKNFIAKATQDGAKLIVLPENFAFMGSDAKAKLKHKEIFGEGIIQDFLKHEAAQWGVWIVGGTIPLASPDEKVFASSLVFNHLGECVARYDKIHLFDIELHAQGEIHQESHTICPGNSVVVFDSPVGKCGLAVCYDIRFPELFRAMQVKGAELVALPAAFTVPTGMAHWDILVRARAIENQVYMLAAAQSGTHSLHRRTYGHGMIVNPWGTIDAMLTNDVGVVSADLDLELLYHLRKDFPVLAHQKPLFK